MTRLEAIKKITAEAFLKGWLIRFRATGDDIFAVSKVDNAAKYRVHSVFAPVTAGGEYRKLSKHSLIGLEMNAPFFRQPTNHEAEGIDQTEGELYGEV